MIINKKVQVRERTLLVLITLFTFIPRLLFYVFAGAIEGGLTIGVHFSQRYVEQLVIFWYHAGRRS
jgi:hypothetical protein